MTVYSVSGSELESVSATDTTYDSGGVSYDATLNDGTAVYVDQVALK